MLAMGVGEPVRRRGYAAGPGAAGSIGRRAGGSRWGVPARDPASAPPPSGVNPADRRLGRVAGPLGSPTRG